LFKCPPARYKDLLTKWQSPSPLPSLPSTARSKLSRTLSLMGMTRTPTPVETLTALVETWVAVALHSAPPIIRPSPSSLTTRLVPMELLTKGTSFPFLPSLLCRRLFRRLAQTPPKLPQFLTQRKRSLRPRSFQPHRPRCCLKWRLQVPAAAAAALSAASAAAACPACLPCPCLCPEAQTQITGSSPLSPSSEEELRR
jgi:hypothetical protein